MTPEEYAAYSTPMEYNFKGIPLGRQGRRRDYTKMGVLKLALVNNWLESREQLLDFRNKL